MVSSTLINNKTNVLNPLEVVAAIYLEDPLALNSALLAVK